MVNDTRRIYGTVRDIPVEELVEAFGCLDQIRGAVLFGSRACQKAPASGSRSDYDFGVVLDKTVPCDWGHLASARVAIGQKLQLPDIDFDVVDLEIASTELKKSIREKFMMLKGDRNVILRLLG